MSDYPLILIAVTTVFAVSSLFFVRQVATAESFFKGFSISGKQPDVWTLTLSQVTTWLFARSLMNAAILGYYYGFWGVLAYATYYFSFLTGAAIVDNLRFRHGCHNVQGFLKARYGLAGTLCYNVVIAVRLVSEVFSNLLVIALFFGITGSVGYTLAVILFSLFTLGYSFIGGLLGSMRTDRFQMVLFSILLLLLFGVLLAKPEVGMMAAIESSFAMETFTSEPGLILIIVALLQVFSYPLHDPVMMDRGFISDRETTKQSFHYAFVISFICILLFGCFGLLAAYNDVAGVGMEQTLMQLMGPGLYLVFQLCLIISAVSTLDSTLSSSAKLVVADMQVFGKQPSVQMGRWVMVLFMLAGIGLVFWGNQDLFDAVAISGTASMFLLPVVFFNILGNDKYGSVRSYVISFVAAIGGAVLYFLETAAAAGYLDVLQQLLGTNHKYMKLLVICVGVMVVSHLAFMFDRRIDREQPITL